MSRTAGPSSRSPPTSWGSSSRSTTSTGRPGWTWPATDNYTDPSVAEWDMQSAMHYDLVRSVNKDIPWMVMEQTSSRVNWRQHNAAKVPGQMRAMSYQAVARGATGLLFFQWRASRAGAEKFHSAMLSHSGVASPVWKEVSGLGMS